MKTALAILLCGAMLYGDSGYPDPVWQDFAVTDSEGRILGTFLNYTSTATIEPRFSTVLWADTAAKSPGKPRPRLGLGYSLHKRGEWLQGQRRFKEASAAYEQAAGAYREVIQISQSGHYRLEAQMGLVGLYAQVNEFGDAERLVQDVLRDNPDHLPAIIKLAYIRLFLAGIFMQQGRRGDAFDAYYATLEATDLALNRKIFDYGFSFGTLFSYRGQAHAALGNCEAANKEFEVAHRQDPDIPLMRCTRKG